MKPNPNCDYANDGERITQPGKFEGEPVFAPYFWQLAMEGFCDGDDGGVVKFRVGAKDKEHDGFPTLRAWRILAEAPELLSAMEAMTQAVGYSTYRHHNDIEAAYVGGRICSVGEFEHAQKAIAKAKGIQ